MKQVLFAFATMILAISTISGQNNTDESEERKRIYLTNEFQLATEETATYYEEWTESEHGRLMGPFRLYYISGKVKKEWIYESEKLNGTYSSYHENGQVEEQGEYVEGFKIGLWQTWHENGQLASKVNYAKVWVTTYGDQQVEMHKKDGVEEQWHQNGQLAAKIFYEGGAKENETMEWHENGQLAQKGAYKDGYRTGIWKSWNESGTLVQKATYKLGQLTGMAEQWFDNAQQMVVYNFDKGVLMKGWDKDGVQLVKEGKGHMKHYNENGALIAEGNYKEGLKTGRWTYYSEDGEATTEQIDGLGDHLKKFELARKSLNNAVFTIVEQSAEPIGGMTAFYKYIKRTLEYPSAAKMLGLGGKVFLSFIVNKSGEITNVEVIRGAGFSLDREAVRVLRGSPKWKPGKQLGRAVKQKMTIPLNFRLN